MWGENRWKFDLEVALTKSIGDDISVQTTSDSTWYWSNNDATTGDRGKLKQDNTYQGQVWFEYVAPADKTWRMALG